MKAVMKVKDKASFEANKQLFPPVIESSETGLPITADVIMFDQDS